MSKSRPLVAIESPYKGDVARNEQFARNVCRYAVLAGYNPFAMHLLFPQFLRDGDQAERDVGITCGLAWTERASEVWFCLRPGDSMSGGMSLALAHHRARQISGVPIALKFFRFAQDGTGAEEVDEF